MRTIKFRGKRLDNGEWVYGDLEHNRRTDVTRIHTYNENGDYERQYVVENISVGQYTGLKDKNSREIYEGDIIVQQGYSGKRQMLVRFEHGAFITGEHSGSSTSTRPMLIQKRCVVIGNIHDNPELPKGGDR